MNAEERRKAKMKLWDSFHPTGGQKHHRVKKNVVHLTPYPAATLEHELCIFIHSFLYRSGCAVEILFPLFLERIPEFVKGIDYKKDREKNKKDFLTQAIENSSGLKRDFVGMEELPDGSPVEFETDAKRAKKNKGQLYLGKDKKVTVYEIPK